MTEQTREGLFCPWPRLDIDQFMHQVDATGGWPLGYRCVGFRHTTARECTFSNSSANDGWWTYMYSSDDYYWWKISEARKSEIRTDNERGLLRKIERLI